MSGMKTDVSGTLSVIHTLEDAMVIPYSLDALGKLDPLEEDAYSRTIRVGGINGAAVIYSVTDFRKENPNVHAKYCTKDLGTDDIRKLEVEVPETRIVEAAEQTGVVFWGRYVDLEEAIELLSHIKELAETETIIERIPKERLGRQRGNAKTSYRNITISGGILSDPPYQIQDCGRGKGPIVNRYYSLSDLGEVGFIRAEICPTYKDRLAVPLDCEELTF